MIWELLVRLVVMVPAWVFDRLDEMDSGLVSIGYNARSVFAQVAAWEPLGPLLHIINPSYLATMLGLVVGFFLFAFLIKSIRWLIASMRDVRGAVTT